MINCHLAKVFSSSCISDFMGLLPTNKIKIKTPWFSLAFPCLSSLTHPSHRPIRPCPVVEVLSFPSVLLQHHSSVTFLTLGLPHYGNLRVNNKIQKDMGERHAWCVSKQQGWGCRWGTDKPQNVPRLKGESASQF